MKSDYLTDKKSSTSPLYEQRGSIIFMLFLLVVSGITATVVGYRVKSADMLRKNELLDTYQALGGTFADSLKLDTSLSFSDRFNDKQKVFITVFETNVRTRLHGFPNVLETIDRRLAPLAIRNLFEINATEAAKSFRDAWDSYAPDIVTAKGTPQGNGEDKKTYEAEQFAAQASSRAQASPGLITSTYQSTVTRPPLNATALRYARQYDRHIVRDTELKLFQYLNKNRSVIRPQTR